MNYNTTAEDIADYTFEARKQCALIVLSMHWQVGKSIMDMRGEGFSIDKLYSLVEYHCKGNCPSSHTLLVDTIFYSMNSDWEKMEGGNLSYQYYKETINAMLIDKGLDDDAVWQELMK